MSAKSDKAIFAGGCFWCLEPPFEKIDGVSSVVSGYIGGDDSDAKYELVASGKTRHVEAVQITYDTKKVTYERLVDTFLRQIDPTDAKGQFIDQGPQYRTGIYYLNQKQKTIAEKSIKKLKDAKKFKEEIVVQVKSATTFYQAEKYHQDYYKKKPFDYNFYRVNSGRDQFIEKHWKTDK